MYLSIIIPVYNSADYLRRCLDSVKYQSFTDYEALLIDDGSTDSSEIICKEYAENDDRFKYYRRPMNGGASAARNDGIRLSSGSYIMFIDNDDWIEGSDAFAALQSTIQNNNEPDIVAWPMGEYIENVGKLNLPVVPISKSINELDFKTAVLSLLKENNYYSSASGKIVKKQLVVSNNLKFDVNLKHNEDSDWSLKLLYYAKSIKWIDSSYYVYRRNSASSTSSKANCANVVNSIESIIDKHLSAIETQPISSHNIIVANNFVAYLFVLLVANVFSMPKIDQNRINYIAKLKKNLWILEYDAQTRVKFARIICSLFGLNILGELLSKALNTEKRRLKR